MDDPSPNSDEPAVVPATKAKKKKKAPQGTKKSRSELTSEEIAKLDAESTKRQNRADGGEKEGRRGRVRHRAHCVGDCAVEGDAQEKEDIVSKAHALLMMGLCCLTNFADAPFRPASTGSSVVRPS
ncbi:hypothetical protein D1007_48249 [Hordeum vulgare]|nr:hypothetical protein D1007_48249 [Hordeum vulgare]